MAFTNCKPRPFKFILHSPSTNERTGDLGRNIKAVMSLVERSVDGRNFVVPSYASTSVRQKELRWSRLSIYIRR